MKSIEEIHSMKYRYSIIFLIIIVLSCTAVLKSSTGLNKASLRIEITNTRASYLGMLPLLYDSIIVLKNNMPFRILDGTKAVHTLSPLDTGLYTIHYRSIYKKEESKTIYISTFKSYNTSICADSLDYKNETYIPIINQLQDKERYTIAMQTSGCFNFESDTLTIHKRKGKYYATWQSDVPTKHSQYLTPKQIETIRKFELELNYMNNKYRSTTKDTYTISFREKTHTFVDGSLSWFGYFHLRGKI